MAIDKNSKLCSKQVQRHITSALDIIDSVSLRVAIDHNPIEQIRIERAIHHLRQVVTNKRTCQLYKGGVI
jgi:hypothetical protein